MTSRSPRPLAPKRAALLGVALAALAACQPIDEVRPSAMEEALHADDACAVTVLTYNIRVGYGARDPGLPPHLLRGAPKRLEAIVEAIRSVDADVVALQEVLGSRQAGELARALGMHYAYAGHPTRQGGTWWGVAVLSRLPIVGSDTLYMPSRAGLLVTVMVGDRELTVASIHRSTSAADHTSVRAVERHLRRARPPFVIAGDFNMLPDDPRMDALRPRFEDALRLADTPGAHQARGEGTFRSGARIDFVLVEQASLRVLEAGMMSRAHAAASDHRGAFARVRHKRGCTPAGEAQARGTEAVVTG